MADKRPQEEKNEKEKDSKKKEKESHAELLKKWIAERVTKFLSTSEWQQAMNKGKDFFVTQFLSSWESSDEDAVAAFKELIGKKADEELNLKDLADIKISYDTTFENYIEWAEKSQFTKLQEKVITDAFLEKMEKEIGGKYFDQPHRDAWKQYVMSKKDEIVDRADLQRHMKLFFNRAGLILNDEQKKRLNKVSIELRDVAAHMTEKAGFDKDAASKLNAKEIIVANTDVEDMVKRFLRSYAQNEVAPAFARFQKETADVAAIYKVPGFQRVLDKFDLSAETLVKNDKAFAEIYNNKELSQEKKNKAQQEAMVRAIAKEDKELSNLVDGLFAHDFNLAKLSKQEQQLYVDRFQSMWADSKEMKKFDELFTKIGVDVSDREDLMKQIFDLSKNELVVTGKDGKKYTLSLQKKIIDRHWSGETVTDFAHELPIAFLISANENLDETYIQKLAKVTDKEFTLRDADGKEVKLFPGHLVEITTKDGKKHTGYIYRDPENNIMLSSEPGGKNRVLFSEDEMKKASVKVIESTYSLKAEDIPVLVSEIALMRAAAQLPEAEQQKAIEERNTQIATNVIDAVEEEKKAKEKHVTHAEIEDIDREEVEDLNDMNEEEAKEWKKRIDSRLHDISRRIDKLNKSIDDQDAIIKSLNEQLKVQNVKKSLDPKAVKELKENLTQAKEKREELLDEKHDLQKKEKNYQAAQKKVQDKLQSDKNKDKNKKKQPESIADVLAESDEKEKTFAQSWADLNGDKTLDEPQPGKSCLMLLLPDTSSSTSGGGWAWMRGDVIGYDKVTQTLQIKWHGVEAKLESKDGTNLEWKVTTIQGADGLQALKRAASKLYKFKKYNTIVDWGLDLKGSIDTSDSDHSPDAHFHFDKKYEGWVKHLKDDIDFSSMRNQRTKKDIKYFGRKAGKDRVWYEVDPKSGTVKITEIKLETGKDEKDNPKKELKTGYKKEMSINDFMMFAMEKDLRGYTQEEVDTANGGDQDSERKGWNYIDDMVEAVDIPSSRMGSGLFGLKWGNIAGVMSSWDIVKKWVKNYFDEKTKKSKTVVENTMLSSKWFKWLEKLPLVGGAFDDIRWGIESKLDNEKKKRINEYKDEVGTKKDTSSSGGSDFIKAVLTDKEAHKYPEKAAGYYLYALEQGNPYFRSLKDFNGTGWWVGKILGPERQQQYLAYIKNIENELAKNPSSKELNNDLSMGELWFMQKIFNEGGDNGVQAKLKQLLGNWFFTGGLGQAQYGMWYNSAKIEETVKNEGAKPFHQLYGDAWTGWYEASRVNDVLGVLKLLSEKVGSNEDYYYQWAGAMLMPLANGQYRTDMSPSYKSIYQSIARKNAFPFAAYMTEGNATEKMQELFDMVSDGSLSEAFANEPKEKDGKKLTELAVRTGAFKKWWEANGRKALDKLQNPKELFSLKKKLEGDLGNQEKLNKYNVLTDYINHKYNDDDRNGITEQVDGESIIYQKNIFSAPSGFVKEQMLNFSNGQFKGRSEKNGPELWEALKAKLNDIDNIPEGEMSPDFFGFLLKRYFAMFHQKYNSTTKRTFIASLKFGHEEPGIFQFNVRGIFDKKFGGTDLPAEVEDALVLFERIFEKHGKVLQKQPDILEEVFDDSRMVDYYVNATKADTLKTVDTLKQKQKERQRMIDEGIIVDDDQAESA